MDNGETVVEMKAKGESGLNDILSQVQTVGLRVVVELLVATVRISG